MNQSKHAAARAKFDRPLASLRVLSSYDDNNPNRDPEELHPLLVKFKEMAGRWLRPLRSIWAQREVEVYLEAGRRVWRVASTSNAGMGSEFSAELPGAQDGHIGTLGGHLPLIAWVYFGSF